MLRFTSCTVPVSRRRRLHDGYRSAEHRCGGFFLKKWIRDVDNLSGCCDHCKGTFRYRLIHNGFNDSAYGYCSSCSSTVLLSGYNPVAQRVGLAIHQRITPQIEALLKRGPCGDRFRASADPKCPHCARTLSATEATAYIERDAPGAKKDWCWQQSWSGIYSIVLNDHFLEDWWDEDAVERLYSTNR